MLSYLFYYRRPGQWLWRKLECSGQDYSAQADRVIFQLADGSVYELPEISKCEVRYGKDFFATMNAAKAKQEATNANVSGVPA